MAATRLKLTRDQLASFLKDHEQIRQFENLFAIVDEISASDLINEAVLTAAGADNKAVQALTQIADLAQSAAICCALSEQKATEALDAIETLRRDAVTAGSQTDALLHSLQTQIDGLLTTPPPREFKRTRYGSFLDTTTQTATTINTAKAVTFNTTDISRGVYIGSPTSRIYVDTEGVYDFQMSLQLDSTVSTDEHFYLWVRVNGTNVPNSASTVRLKGNDAEIILSLNFFLDLKAEDYVEMMYSVTDLGVRIQYVAATSPVPAIPSIILTVNNGIEGVQ